MARKGGITNKFYKETRGLKVSGGQVVSSGTILTRQGHRWKPGIVSRGYGGEMVAKGGGPREANIASDAAEGVALRGLQSAGAVGRCAPEREVGRGLREGAPVRK